MLILSRAGLGQPVTKLTFKIGFRSSSSNEGCTRTNPPRASTGEHGPVAYSRASSADRAAYFRASTGTGTGSSARGDGRGACRSQGGRPAAAVFRPSGTARTHLLPHPFTNSPPNSRCWGRAEQEEVVRCREGGSSGASAVGRRFTGGLRAVPACDGSAGGGKTARSGERRPRTAVPRHETGRRHLGTVPRDDGPCLASCLVTNDRW